MGFGVYLGCIWDFGMGLGMNFGCILARLGMYLGYVLGYI